MSGVGEARKSIPQNWLAKGLGLLCWGFKGVQEEIPSGEASTLEIGPVAFPPGQCTTTPSLSQTIWPRWASRQFLILPIIQTLLPVTFGYSLSSQAVVIRQLRRWKRLWRRSLTRWQEDFHGAFQTLLEQYNKCIAVGGEYFEGDWSFMCVLSIKVPIRKNVWKLIKWSLYLIVLITIILSNLFLTESMVLFFCILFLTHVFIFTFFSSSVTVSLFNGISTFVGYLMTKPFF